MISRHWTGITRPDRAEDYLRHLRHDTFPGLSAVPGFVRASVLQRDVGDGTEFRVVTVWESLAAVRGFAGPDPDEAVVPPAVRAMMA